MAYKYCVVEFLPDISAGEKVNIGVEVHDMETKILYKKYTSNVDEIERRYGYSPLLLMVLSGLNEPPNIEEDKEYLNKKHSRDCSVYEHLFWGEVRGGLIYNKVHLTCEDALKHLYDMFVLLDK